MTDLELKIYQLVRQIPRGKVAAYGYIARLAGDVHLARVVGNIMHKNPLPFWQLAESLGCKEAAKFKNQSQNPVPEDFEPVPCHRVVNAAGKPGAAFGMGGPEIQIKMLMAEGVKIENGKVCKEFMMQN